MSTRVGLGYRYYRFIYNIRHVYYSGTNSTQLKVDISEAPIGSNCNVNRPPDYRDNNRSICRKHDQTSTRRSKILSLQLMLRTVFPKFSRFAYEVARKTIRTNMGSKSALLVIADGTEEMEAVITADVLRRGGVDVTVASLLDANCVKCSRNIKICADAKLADVSKSKKYDVVILPGGLGGSKAFASSAAVGDLLKEQEKEDRIIAAICAAPVALKAHGIGKGKQITSYPSMKDELADEYNYSEAKVVTDGNLITSRGPGTAFDFGLAIVEKLVSKETASTVAKAMLHPY